MSSGGREFLREKMEEEDEGFASVGAAMAVNGFSSEENFRVGFCRFGGRFGGRCRFVEAG